MEGKGESSGDFRPPTTHERLIWQRYREWCLRSGMADPGPVPEEWPVRPRQTSHAIDVLTEAIIRGENEPRRLAWELSTQRGEESVALPEGSRPAPDELCDVVSGLPIRVGPRFVALYGTPGIGVYVNEGRTVYGLVAPGEEANRLLEQWPAAGPARKTYLLFDRRRMRCWWADSRAVVEFVSGQAAVS